MSPSPIGLDVDGRAVEVPEGATLAQACARAGVTVPTLCHLERLTPPSACRLCVVEVEGTRALVPACSRRAEAGMRVLSASPRVLHARRLVLELLASSVDLSRAPALLELMREHGADPARFGAAAVAAPPRVDNPLFVRDLARCVLCMRCTQACGPDAQHTYAIWVAGRGLDARVATEFDASLPESECVYCGNCVAVCPTGALVPRTEFDLREAGSWHPERQTVTTTVCPYCGVGCSLDLRVQDGEVVGVTSPGDHDITRGNLCVKGRFGTGFVSGPRPAV